MLHRKQGLVYRLIEASDKLSQVGLAEHLGIHPTHVSKMLLSQRISWKYMAGVAAYLGVTLEALIRAMTPQELRWYLHDLFPDDEALQDMVLALWGRPQDELRQLLGEHGSPPDDPGKKGRKR